MEAKAKNHFRVILCFYRSKVNTPVDGYRNYSFEGKIACWFYVNLRLSPNRYKTVIGGMVHILRAMNGCINQSLMTSFAYPTQIENE